MDHPCLRCGACCAAFRVSFHWREAADANPNGVPMDLCQERSSILRDMRGTRSDKPRCIALVGTVGDACQCNIYAQRPSPCRELRASYENGEPSPLCDRARDRHGLRPLTPDDWAARMDHTCDTLDLSE